MSKEYDCVILDGANIIHQNKVDNDGNKILLTLPERLEAAILHCEERGWPVTAFLKKGTYLHAIRSKHLDTIGDVDILDRLIGEKKVILIDRRKDDIYWIDYAVKKNGYIVTHDKFADKNDTKGERTLYPKRDWLDIDQRTLRDWEFLGDDFILPGLPIKQKRQELEDELSIESFNKLMEKIVDLEKLVLENRDLIDTLKGGDKQIEPEEENTEIVHSVFDSMLTNGDRVEVSHLQRSIASAVLGHDIETYPKSWPKGWGQNLSKVLGTGRRIIPMLESCTPRKLCFKVLEDGQNVVFYC